MGSICIYKLRFDWLIEMWYKWICVYVFDWVDIDRLFLWLCVNDDVFVIVFIWMKEVDEFNLGKLIII